MYLAKMYKHSELPSLTKVQRGIWQVLMIDQPFFDFHQYWNDTSTALPLIQRFFRDIYHLEPLLFGLYLIAKLWNSVESAMVLYFSTHLLRTVEDGIKRNTSDLTVIIRAILFHLLCQVTARLVRRKCNQLIPDLQSRVTSYYELLLMKADLEVDIPTAKEPGHRRRATCEAAWGAFEGIAQLVFGICTTAIQIFFMMHSYRSIDRWFLLICSARPLLEMLLHRRNLWGTPHVFFVNNAHYLRKKALKQMVTDEFKQDILCNNFLDYLFKEYAQCLRFLHGMSQDLPFFESDEEVSATSGIVRDIMGDLPMAYAAITAVRNPNIFSISSVAIVEQFALSLRFALEGVLNSIASLNQHVNQIRELYIATEVKNTIPDGHVPYPESSKLHDRGMSVELRNVSFSYPGTQMATSSLKNVSLSIKSGQLVVLVGANGSGKSTLMKLLSRLYDPSSGEIKIDGKPMDMYKVSDLRSATAVLSQEHRLFPLSLAENVGLGNIDRVDDVKMILEAAEKGGAMKCIERLAEGVNTVLDPMFDVYSHNIEMDSTGRLEKEMMKLRKAVDLSGGERQRLVASRAFMRFKTGKVKLVLVDEPSSALDAEGELRLFDNLQAEKNGKTMIFVTHRFGHLTKHADLVVCMKDGEAIESGTHDQLMRLKGEYAKLYDIQASAFQPA